jgi:DNA-binding beta-propeller fold protein YncE
MTKIFKSFFIAITIAHFFLITPVIKAEVVATIPVGVPAYRVAITPDGLKALVTSPGLNTLTAIDLDTNSISDTLSLPGSTNAGLEITITNDGNKALITNYTDKNLIIVDIDSISVEGEPIPIGVSASGITVLSNNRTLLIPNEGNCGDNLHCLSIFETVTPGDWENIELTANIPVNKGPRMAGVTPDHLTALIPNGGLSGEGTTVNIVETTSIDNWSTASVTNTINVGGQPTVVALTPDGDTALVTNVNDGTINVLEASSSTAWLSADVVKTITTLDGVGGIAFTPDGKTALVTGNSGVQQIKAQSMDDWSGDLVFGEFVPLSGTPNKISITPNGKKAVVTQYHAGTVSILSLEPAISCVATYEELQNALTQAADNGKDDIIHIVQGTYEGNFEYSSLEPYDLTIEGGYYSGCTERVINSANTTLDGLGTGPVLTFNASDTSADFVVDGITLKNGNSISHGGGLYGESDGEINLTNNMIVNNTSFRDGGLGLFSFSHITLRNNTINNNNAIQDNGGVYINSSNGIVTIDNNDISFNDAQSGAGGLNILSPSGTLILKNNTICNNNAQSGAGGMNYDSTVGSLLFTNNKVVDNQTYGAGGGVYINSSVSGNYTLINNLISGNCVYSSPWSPNSGGGLYFYSQLGFLNLNNNTIINNSAFGSGGGAWLRVSGDDAELDLLNNIILNNNSDTEGNDIYISNDNNHNYIASIVYMNNNDFDQSSSGTYIQIPFSIDTSNLNNLDPQFDIDGYHLTNSSPCIDAGTSVNAPEDDIDGDSRPQGAGYDIGADEYVSVISIDSILGFFDASVADGTLEGDGPGKSAKGRLNALRNMLEMAGDLISVNDYEGACRQLNAASRKCDDVSRPPDFVAGPAVAELYYLIVELMDELGCE